MYQVLFEAPGIPKKKKKAAKVFVLIDAYILCERDTNK